MEDFQAFRKAAVEAGLMFERGSQYRRDVEPYVPRFVFDLNMGPITLLVPTPERVMLLVRLARRHARHDGYGEHNALLERLSVPRQELEGNPIRVYWSRSSRNDGGWITLRQWLIEHGQDPSSIYKEADSHQQQ